MASSSLSWMSFQRMTDDRVLARAEQAGDRCHARSGRPRPRARAAGPAGRGVLEAVELADGLVELQRRAQDHCACRLACGDHLDAEEEDAVRRLIDVVADVVERAGKPVHVVAVERGHERPVEEIDDLVRQPVAVVLTILHLADQLAPVLGKAIEQLDKQTSRVDGVRGRAVVEAEELLLRREADLQAHVAAVLYHGSARGGAMRGRQRREGIRTGSYPDSGDRGNPDFQAYFGQGQPHFAHDAELECAKILDYYRIPWAYEPRTFVLEEDEKGRIVEAFTPDFYLPEQDLYLEVTVMKQSLVTRKNRKLRKIRERYPDVRVKLFYKRDIERLAQRYRLDLAS